MSYFPVEDWKKRAIDAERRLAVALAAIEQGEKEDGK